MPYSSTKLTFYPGEALIKFQIFHWDVLGSWSHLLHTSPSDLHPLRTMPSASVTLGCQWNWNKPLLLLFFMCRRVIKLKQPLPWLVSARASTCSVYIHWDMLTMPLPHTVRAISLCTSSPLSPLVVIPSSQSFITLLQYLVMQNWLCENMILGNSLGMFYI